MGSDIKSASNVAKKHAEAITAVVDKTTTMTQGISGGYTTCVVSQRIGALCAKEQGVSDLFFQCVKRDGEIVNDIAVALEEMDRDLAK